MKNYSIFSVIVILLFISCSQEQELFPKYFFDLNLTKKLSGVEAKDLINRLHLNSVTNEKNEIGFYNGIKGNAVIYITYYNDVNTANYNYEKMVKKISPENSVFTESTFINISNRRIYRTFGMGQTHYVFTFTNKLFWISAESGWAQDFLSEYIKILD